MNLFLLFAFQGLGERANDSLDMMFDTTAYGEYKSYNTPQLGQSQPCGDDDDDEDDDDEEQEEEEGSFLDFNMLCLSSCNLTLVIS